MHRHNHSHGAAQILAIAATGDRVWTVPSIPGHIQHSSDLLRPCPAERELPASLTAFVWSRAAVTRRQQLGLRNQVATGAPWLYLLDLDPALLEPEQLFDPQAVPPPPAPPASPSGSLVFVEHGLEGAFLVPHLVAAARDQLGPDFTVALQHRDALTAPIVAAYTELGVPTLDLGPSADDPGSTEPRELTRLYHVMLQFETVAANSPREELFYAVALDRPISLIDAAPQHRAVAMNASELAQVARAELGTDDKLPPEELRDLFEWSARRA